METAQVGQAARPNIEILEPIIVDVAGDGAAAVAVDRRDPGLDGDVGESPVSLVAVEEVVSLNLGREEEVKVAVSVEVEYNRRGMVIQKARPF